MNSGLPEMLHCSEASEMSVLERQRSVLKWQNEKQLGPHQPLSYFNGNSNDQLQLSYLPPPSNDQGLCEVVNGAMKPDPDVEEDDDDGFRKLLNYGSCSDFEISSALPRTVSCPPSVATGKQSCKKRKADKIQSLKVAAEEKTEQKKMKECGENSNSKSTTTTLSTSANKNSKAPSKQSAKGAEAPKTDYIHVRARRGQATDSHSLAERVRREKISERMKYLQDLVPGCNKVTGKAGMLDEIINYVQSLQRQVEFLSMKLAAINPRLDFDIESYIMKEIFPGCHTIGTSSSSMVNQCHLQFNAAVQEMVVDSMDDATLRRTISAPIPTPQAFLDSSSLNQIQQQITWEDELQNLYSMEYQQGRSPSFISQPITDFMEANHVKLEM